MLSSCFLNLRALVYPHEKGPGQFLVTINIRWPKLLCTCIKKMSFYSTVTSKDQDHLDFSVHDLFKTYLPSSKRCIQVGFALFWNN